MNIAHIGTLMPGESASVEFPSGRVVKNPPERVDEGWCLPPMGVADFSDEPCSICGCPNIAITFKSPGSRDDYGNFPQYARLKRECQRCGAKWYEATQTGTEKRKKILEQMPRQIFQTGDKVIHLYQRYADDGNTKIHIDLVFDCEIMDKPFLSQEFGGEIEAVWRYRTKVPGYGDHYLTLAQDDLIFATDQPV